MKGILLAYVGTAIVGNCLVFLLVCAVSPDEIAKNMAVFNSFMCATMIIGFCMNRLND